MVLVQVFSFGERTFHREKFQELLFASLIIMVFDYVHDSIPDDIRYVHADAFTHKGVTALVIHHRTLLVHHIVVFQEALTDTEVVFLNFLLCSFDTL